MPHAATAHVSRATKAVAIAATDLTRRQLVIFATIVVVSIVARLYHIDEFGLWLDEIWTIETATGRGSPHTQMPQDVIIEHPPTFAALDEGAQPWWRIWSGMREVTHPPLYMMMLRGWMELFGTSARAVRSLSAVASVVAVVLTFDVVRLLRGADAALWAAAILSLAGTQIQFAQEGRPYAVMVALALAAAAALVRIERRGATAARLATFGASLLALMLLHYFAAGTAAALVAHGLLRTNGAQRRRLMLTVALSAAVFALAWGPFIWINRASFTDANAEFLRDAAAGHLPRTWWRLAEMPARLLSEYLNVNTLAALAAVAICLAAAYRARRFDDLLLWTMWLVATVGLVFLLDLFRGTQHLLFLRYTYLASPALCAIVATLMWDARGWFRHVLPAIVIAGSLLVFPDAAATFFRANWRDVGLELGSRLRAGDVLVLAGETSPYASNAYLCLSYYIPPAQRPPIALVTRQADARLVQQLKAAPGVVLITDMYQPDKQAQILGPCEQHLIVSAPGVGDIMRVTWP
jgi:uncharacterized membrane protein